MTKGRHCIVVKQNCIFTFVQPLQCLPNHANLELIPGKAGNDYIFIVVELTKILLQLKTQ